MVLLEEHTIFLFEGFVPMMLYLVRNVVTDGLNIGLADGESPIASLPCKPGKFGSLALKPFG